MLNRLIRSWLSLSQSLSSSWSSFLPVTGRIIREGRFRKGQPNDYHNTKGAAHGNSEKAQEVAAKFAFTIKSLQASCSKAGASLVRVRRRVCHVLPA